MIDKSRIDTYGADGLIGFLLFNHPEQLLSQPPLIEQLCSQFYLSKTSS